MAFFDHGTQIDFDFVEWSISILTVTETTGDSGSTVQEYSSRQVSQARIEQPPVAQTKKAGVKIGPYDPVLSALLAGEL